MLMAVAWIALISALSHGFVDSRAFVHTASQSLSVSESGFSNFWQQWWWLFVKGWHVLEFLVLTLLIHRALQNLRVQKPLVGAVGLSIGIAALDEWHQTFIPYRGGLATDVAIDCLGIALATALILLSRHRAVAAT